MKSITKKLIFTVFITVICISGLYAQKSVSGIYNKFAKEQGAESLNLGGFFCKIGAMFVDCENSHEKRLLKAIGNIYILDVSGCREDIKKKFCDAASSLDNAGYEFLMEASDNSEQLKIFIKKEKDKINDLLIYSTGDEPCLINIGGNFKISDVENLIAYGMNSKQ